MRLEFVSTVPRGKLDRLATEGERIAKQMAVHPAAVTSWVLRGKRPVFPRIGICRHISTNGYRTWATIEIGAADITWRELWVAYRRIRSLPNMRRQKTESHPLPHLSASPRAWRRAQTGQEAGFLGGYQETNRHQERHSSVRKNLLLSGLTSPHGKARYSVRNRCIRTRNSPDVSFSRREYLSTQDIRQRM